MKVKKVSIKKMRKRAGKSLLFRRFFMGILFIFPFVVIAGVISLYLMIRDLPDIYDLKDYRPSISTRIYADGGQLVHEFFTEDRRVLHISKVPKYLPNAFVAAEDSRFFEHEGIDLHGIARAFLKNIEHGAIVQGGSTITQQVAKSFYLSSERTMGRKIKEAILAYKIDKYLKKYEILNLYLNQIYLGHGTYGMEAASQCYFGKSARDLNLAEAAILAGLPKAPSKFSPFSSLEKARQRQNYVLTRMVEDGYISESEKEAALKTRIRLNPQTPKGKLGPYFVENVRRYILAKYGSDVLYKEGLDIYTTLNADMQRAAEAAVERGLQELEKREGYRSPVKRIQKAHYKTFLESVNFELEKKPLERGLIIKGLVESVDEAGRVVKLSVGKHNATASFEDIAAPGIVPTEAEKGAPKSVTQLLHPGDTLDVRVIETGEPLKVAIELKRTVQGALLCMDAKTGGIKAMVGGRDFSQSEFNRATQARRQPGSAFKPLIYTAAFDKGIPASKIIVDEAISFKGSLPGGGEWTPQNFDQEYHGPTSLRTALVYSRNIVTIKLLQEIGVDYAVDYAANLGITSPLSKNLSLALGTSAVTLQEIVRAFGVLANEGKRVEPFFITKIVDRTGNVFEQHEPVVQQVIDPKVAFITTSILQDAVQRGTGTRVKPIDRPVAGKTGTTDDLKDAWFVGYTPSLVAGVWVGFDDGKPLGKKEVGGLAAAPIWLYFMEKAVADKPVESFPVPEDIVTVKIDPKTGLLAKPLSSEGVTEYFLGGTAPTDYSSNPLENKVMKLFLGTPEQKKSREQTGPQQEAR
jgi:penicillin-binding protein 1A